MLAVTFGVDGGRNCVVIGDRSYVFVRSEHGSFILPARCPHRGGPLHLAQFTEDKRLRCPWHGRATSVSRWLREGEGIPAARRGRIVTAVFDVDAQTPFELEYRPLAESLNRTRSLNRTMTSADRAGHAERAGH